MSFQDPKLIAFAILLVICQSCQKAKEKPNLKDPNFIFILADDMGIGRFKVALENLSTNDFDPKIILRDKNRYPVYKARTDAIRSIPNLTALANEGVYFNNSFASSPWCSPSRVSILTGQYPHRLGAWVSNDLRASDITKNASFLSSAFKALDYNTALIGKWHLGNNEYNGGLKNRNHPMDKGFDEFWGFDFSGSRYYDSKILLNGRRPVRAAGFLTDQFTDKAIDFINRQKSSDNFFLFLSYSSPHGPLDLAPFEYYQHFGDRANYNRNDVKNKEVTDTKGPSLANNYNAHVYAMDKGIARIVEQLKSTGLDSNTIVVFTSDHGASGFETTPLPANSPYLGYKGQYYEGSLRVPLLFWNPYHINPQRSSVLTMGFDILPTLLSMAGLDISTLNNLDGRDLTPVVFDEVSTEIHDHLVWAGAQSTAQGIETEHGKLSEDGIWWIKDDTHYLRHTYNVGFELYGNEDVAEKNNLATTANSKRVNDLLENYKVWFDSIAIEPIYFKHVHDQVNMSKMEILND